MWDWYCNRRSWPMHIILRVAKHCWVSRFYKPLHNGPTCIPTSLIRCSGKSCLQFFHDQHICFFSCPTFPLLIPGVTNVGANLTPIFATIVISLVFTPFYGRGSTHFKTVQYSVTYITVLRMIYTPPNAHFVTYNPLGDILFLVVLSLSRTSLKIPGPEAVNLGNIKCFETSSGI